MAGSGKVAIICTSKASLPGAAGPTGAWAEEVAAPFFAFKDAGYDVTLASVSGGPIPWEPKSLTKDFITPAVSKLLEEHNDMVANSRPLASLSSSDFDAIFLAGGHGTMFDFFPNPTLGDLISDMWAAGKGVAGVCHGPAGLLAAQEGDRCLVAGKRVTGFSNSEQRNLTNLTDLLPFSLENKLKEAGAKYEAAPDMAVHVVVDGRLVTGQNPPSSEATAQKLVDAIRREP